MSDKKEKIIIFVTNNCPPCDKLLGDIKEKDKIEVRNVDRSKKDLELALKHGLSSAPSALLKEGKKYKVCDIYFDKEKKRPVAECEDRIIEL